VEMLAPIGSYRANVAIVGGSSLDLERRSLLNDIYQKSSGTRISRTTLGRVCAHIFATMMSPAARNRVSIAIASFALSSFELDL